MSLEYSRLTCDNFHIHVKDIMASEEVFPEDIRETPENYLHILRHADSIGLVASINSSYVGNVLGFSPSEDVFSELRLDEISIDKNGLIYLYNIVTMPQFQSKGYGRELLSLFISKATETGFKRVGGHFRNNGSLKNFRGIGGEELAQMEDWFGTGERYSYCELSLPPAGISTYIPNNVSLGTPLCLLHSN